jgi:ADP-heptose:LPS heptosyltransferase
MTSVALVRLSAMGDFVQCLGAIRALVAAKPDWSVTIVTQDSNVPLLEDLRTSAHVATFDRRGGIGAWVRLRRQLRRSRFDHAIDLQGNWKSAACTFACRAADGFGAARPWRQEPASALLLGRTLPVAAGHPAVVAWSLVRQLVPELPFELPRLEAKPTEVAAELEALATLGIDGEQEFHLVVVTNPADPRSLSEARWRQYLAAQPQPGVLLLGPAEADMPEPQGWPILRHGRGQLRRLVALGALAARAGATVVGPDQGATHVLAAAGARCRVVFGSQAPEATAPLGAMVVRCPAPPSCSPCRARRCAHRLGAVCMDFDLTAAVDRAALACLSGPARVALRRGPVDDA